MDAAGDELETLGGLHQEKSLGVGGCLAWGRGRSRAPCHLEGERGLEVGENVDVLGGRWGWGCSQGSRGLRACGGG